MPCPDDFQLVEEQLDRILTQYRESPKLLHLIRTYLRQVEIVTQELCALPTFFDIDTAVGDQLTLLGKRLGFPREHCVCEVQPVFGFECGPNDSGLTVFGFCSQATWIECADVGVARVRINDDELYRKFLKVRRYQTQAYFDLDSLKAAIRILWGPQAMVMDRRNGRVVLAPGRALTIEEQAVLQLYPRVMPVALGINIRFHFYSLNAFGFGAGWGGFCDNATSNGDPITTEGGDPLLTANDLPILGQGELIGADWMCALDVRPYDC